MADEKYRQHNQRQPVAAQEREPPPMRKVANMSNVLKKSCCGEMLAVCEMPAVTSVGLPHRT
jgi:hypothetical protein